MFTTTSVDHRADGFEVGAIHYLVKPVNYQNIKIVMDRCGHLFTADTKYISIVSERHLVRIRIKSKFSGNMLVILVDSSFDGNIAIENGNFLSSKRDGPGIGISSIKAVADRYYGTAKFEHSNNTFIASIMLQLNLFRSKK